MVLSVADCHCVAWWCYTTYYEKLFSRDTTKLQVHIHDGTAASTSLTTENRECMSAGRIWVSSTPEAAGDSSCGRLRNLAYRWLAQSFPQGCMALCHTSQLSAYRGSKCYLVS